VGPSDLSKVALNIGAFATQDLGFLG